MKMYKTCCLLAAIIFWVLPGAKTDAADLYLQGALSSGTYNSDGSIILQAGSLVNSGENVTVRATYEIVLNPGTRIKAGSRFVARNADNDGLSNRCEMLYFGHLNYSPQDDPDVDWLDNYEECSLATNPNLYDLDNDNDGLPDWWEIDYFGLTLSHGGNEDADGDGVSNYVEFKLGANPAQQDLPGPGVFFEYDALGRIKQIYRIPMQ